MSFQAKNNRNAAKRIYNLNSLSNPIILDILKSQQGKFSPYNNLLYASSTKNEQIDDKNSLLSITGKQVLNQNTFIKSSNKHNSRKNKEMVKNIQQIKLIFDDHSENTTSLIERRQQSADFVLSTNQDSEYQSVTKLSSQKILSSGSASQKYCEDIILNDPVLYGKVVSAYKTLQRTMNSKQKTQGYGAKRFSTDKVSGGQKIEVISKDRIPRLLPRINDSDVKNDQQRKKITFFNIYREFQLLLNLSNQCIMIPEQQGQYKAFIGKGNNGLLIKSIIKSRPWWCIRGSTDVDNCNIIWTEWKKPKYMKILPSSKYQRKQIQSEKTQNNHVISKKDPKLQLVLKILQQKKMDHLSSKFDNNSAQQITKFNKKISDPNFSILIDKTLPNYEQKSASKNNKMVNHIPGCFQLHSKKLLFANLKKYYQKKNMNVWDYLPQTYVISKGLNDPQYQHFLEGWQKHEQKKDKTSKNIWICKPGQNSNRGNGIKVAGTLNEIKNFIQSHSSSNGMCSALIQKYMENPFLYNKRKFDIRCYILITTVNGIVKGYWYEDGYIRTTSKQYNLKNIDNKFIHLTNDAVQKKGQTYGKFESFNKVSLPDFQKYLQQNYQNQNLNFKTSFQKMKQMATDLINSVGKKLNPDKKQFSFELFGLDYMVDEKLEAYIIEANSNPCIQVEGNVLGRVIPSMLQNMIRVAIDPIFPPPYSENAKSTKYSPGNVLEQNKFTLVYDSLSTSPSSEEQVIGITKQEEEQERMLEAQIERQNEDQI